MHVVSRGPHIHHRFRLEDHLPGALGLDHCALLEQLLVLVRAEIIVLVLLAYLVVAVVLELPEKQAEEDAHVGVVVQRHGCALLDEEHHQAVVFTRTVDRDPVQRGFKMVGVVRSSHAEIFGLELLHVVRDSLADGV